MQVQWRKNKIGSTVVTHTSRYSPFELLDALESPPLRKVGDDPIVKVHKFKLHEIAVRNFTPPIWESKASFLFRLLQLSVEAKYAIVEMPIAFIEYTNKSIIITLWKKRTNDLMEFFDDQAVSLERKELMLLKIMRQIAKLHATGILHGHISLNIVVNDKDNPYLIDYTRIRLLDPLDFSRKHEMLFPLLLVDAIYSSQLILPPGSERRKKNLINRLLSEYDRYFDISLKRTTEADVQSQ